MFIVSANTTAEGYPVWWTGSRWSQLLSDAIVLDKADAEAAHARAVAHDQTVVAVVEVESLNREGRMRRRQLIRGAGPTVRADLAPLSAGPAFADEPARLAA